MMPRVWNRRKGAPTPPADAVYVGRPTIYGNPYPVPPVELASKRSAYVWSVEQYRRWIMLPEQANLRAKIRTELRGKDLVCWCHPLPCHADVLLEIANA